MLVTRTVWRGGPWPWVLAATVLIGSAGELALPYAIGRAVDRPSVALVALCAGVAACVAACESVGVWARGASCARAAARLRLGLLRHALAVGPAMTRRFPAGELVTRAGLNAEEVGRAPDAVTGTLALLVPTVGAVIALALIDVTLAVTLLAGLALIVLVLRGFLRTTTVLAAGYQEAQGEIAARLVDAMDGARTIAAAGTAERETRRVLAPLARLREHGLRLWRANADAGVRAGLTVPLLEVAVLAVGGFRLAAGDLTLGELYAAARYAVLGASLSTALGHLGGLARARAAAARVAEVLAVEAPRHGVRTLPPGPGELEFRGVAADGLVVGDLLLPGGSVTAVVGRSGSGKSLLAALASRMADPAAGQVLLDGVPLPELDRASLRRAVACAYERPVLLGDTPAEVIGGEAVAAARTARADAFVRRLPRGYDTPLDEAPMSGGERQRLGLARAFAQAERVLVLDDATSGLDTVTEHQISEALTAAGRTRLIVAHRVATAARADQVLWLDGGAVRARGPHRELWRDPCYREVFMTEAR